MDRVYFYYNSDTPGNSKAIPLQTWTGPGSSRGLNLPEFLKN